MYNLVYATELFANSNYPDFVAVEARNEFEQKLVDRARAEMAKHGLQPLVFICQSEHPDVQKHDRFGGITLWGAERVPVICLNRMNLQILDPGKLEYIGLHELGHALAGCEAGHGEAWIQAALNLGDGLVLHANRLYTENGLRARLESEAARG